MLYIQSASNDRVKEIKKLLTSTKLRREEKRYIVEGIRMFREIPATDIETIYLCDDVDISLVDVANVKLQEAIACGNTMAEIVNVSKNAFKAMSGTDTPQGIMATVAIRDYQLEDVLESERAPFLIIAERLQDPGNLGTIIRTSEAAGVTGIIISSDCVDIYNPKTVRSTMGSLFRMPIVISDSLKDDINIIKSKGVTVYGTHLDGNEFYDNDYQKPSAFLIGNEGNGLSDEISATAEKLIRIPMCGSVESLNAATSVAVVGYEVLRQRR